MILLVRHGRTAANAQGLLLGRADVELDEEGSRQAAALGEAVRRTTEGVRQVVSSPLKRCQATAEIVAAALDVPVAVDDRWIELDYGDLDGTPVRSVPAETWAAWMGDVSWAPPGGESLADLGQRVRAACADLVRPPAREPTSAERAERPGRRPTSDPEAAGRPATPLEPRSHVVSGAETTAGLPVRPDGPADHPPGDVLVVSHVSPIKAAIAWALGVGDDLAWRLHVAPASISRIAVTRGRGVLHSFNEVAHLDAG